MKVDVFIPCFIDQFYPQTAFNVMKVLEKAGCSINYNPEQSCCGQPAFNSGYWKESRTLAKKFLHLFHEADVVVSPSASCTGFVRNYFPVLFEDHNQQLEQSVALGSKIIELSDFLVNHLQKTNLGAVFPHRVTYHDSCAALREWGLGREPRTLLKQVQGLELTELAENSTCCGFGGTFAAKFTTVSAAMTQQKVEHALETGAEYIVSTDASCLMNMQAYIRRQKLPIATIHLADILASGY